MKTIAKKNQSQNSGTAKSNCRFSDNYKAPLRQQHISTEIRDILYGKELQKDSLENSFDKHRILKSLTKRKNHFSTPELQRYKDSDKETIPETKKPVSALKPDNHGSPIPNSVRSYFEPRFGINFNDVRIHTGSGAARDANSIDAKAYTFGSDIVFGANQYNPESFTGKKLLAYELVHVTQQTGRPASKISRVRRDSGTAQLHSELAEDYRRIFGLPPGGIDQFGTRIGPTDSQITYSRMVSEVPDLHWTMVERLRPAITSVDTVVRQAALDELLRWGRSMSHLGIDWNRVHSIHYDPNRAGSECDSDNPLQMILTFGVQAFSSVQNLYSTFRHELVHVLQHHDHATAISQGRGVKEVYAYLWELENIRNTGLINRRHWGIDNSGTVDTSVGLARIVDGLMREASRMSAELNTDPTLVPQAEVEELGRRVACALISAPWEVVSAVAPQITREALENACGTQAVQGAAPVQDGPQRAAINGSTPSGIMLPSSPSEIEADDLSTRVMNGESIINWISPQPSNIIQRSLRLEGTGAETDRIRNSLQHLTSRNISSESETIALGDEIPDNQGSPTISRFIEHTISSSRAYRLRAGTTNPDGTPVHGSAWQAEGETIIITVNTADMGEFSWTADELISDVIVSAVTANETDNSQRVGTGDMTENRLLSTTLPYSSDPVANQEMNNHAIEYARTHLSGFTIVQEVHLGGHLARAQGVTFAEILRGFETNTPYRIEQVATDGRVRVVYLDPRETPGPNQPQIISSRTTTFTTGLDRDDSNPAPMTGMDAERASLCNDDQIQEVRDHLLTARAALQNTLTQLSSGTNVNSLLRRHFNTAGTPENKNMIEANIGLIGEELYLSRHPWLCNGRGSGEAGCVGENNTGRSAIGQSAVQFCIESSPPYIPRWTTVLHEIVHCTAIGSLGAGVERYAWQADYPGSDPLHNADSYTQFIKEVNEAHAVTSPEEETAPSQYSLQGAVMPIGGLSIGSGSVQPVLGARLELTVLGPGLSVVDFTSGLTFLWMPQYGVVPPEGGPEADVADRYYAGVDIGARIDPGERTGVYFDVAVGAGAIWPGGGESPNFAPSLRGTVGYHYGTPSAGFTAGVDFQGILNMAERVQPNLVVGLGLGGYFGGTE